MKYYEENSAAMSEDENLDVESDDDDLNNENKSRSSGSQYFSQAEKRAHHNALERKRRDHIKDSFTSLRDSVPSLQGEKVASRAQILKKAAEYIQFMRRKNHSHQQDIEDLKKQNSMLEAQIRSLERARTSGNFGQESANEAMDNVKSEGSSHESSDENEEHDRRNTKRLKTATY